MNKMELEFNKFNLIDVVEGLKKIKNCYFFS